MADRTPADTESAVESTAEARTYQPGSGEPLITCGGRQGTGARGRTAPLPQGPVGPSGATGTE